MDLTQSSQPARPPKPKSKTKPPSPIPDSLLPILTSLPLSLLPSLSLPISTLLSTAPKRWVVYPPLLLLPSSSFTSPSWKLLLSHLSPSQKGEFWEAILNAVSLKEGNRKGKGGGLRCLGINGGIPLYDKGEGGGEGEGERRGEGEKMNVKRSPSGLIMLYGDFGPDLEKGKRDKPTEKEFEEAFWVHTKQNGVVQCWAPRWCMFSRGNVGEKARVLSFCAGEEEGEEEGKEEGKIGGDIAVDVYAGIGYFVFSYIKGGTGRVFAWEINPWSVEGLRRGAIANGWNIRIIQHEEGVGFEESGDERIVVFLENNCYAGRRMEKLLGRGAKRERVKHVNCGLLPSSEGCWEMALGMVEKGGWLHLHENVGVDDVEKRKGEVEGLFAGWLTKEGDEREVRIQHVEYVKTVAPGVWHVVFDVFVTGSQSNT